ncbi:MAG: 5-(carboxyamino)imidazole ribonucleotide mutase [Candidatus Saccharimonadales bacterium]
MANRETNPLVGVVMGSDSDLPALQPAFTILDSFKVPYEWGIKSAHRTPEAMIQYGRTAADRGLQVLIAAAGGSAHLPGMLASETRLPVLGVAIENSPDPMNSALGSMVYMPKGKPLATMGRKEAAAHNAALFAVRILALADPELAARYDAYDNKLAEEVKAKDALAQAMLPRDYATLFLQK